MLTSITSRLFVGQFVDPSRIEALGNQMATSSLHIDLLRRLFPATPSVFAKQTRNAFFCQYRLPSRVQQAAELLHHRDRRLYVPHLSRAASPANTPQSTQTGVDHARLSHPPTSPSQRNTRSQIRSPLPKSTSTASRRLRRNMALERTFAPPRIEFWLTK